MLLYQGDSYLSYCKTLFRRITYKAKKTLTQYYVSVYMEFLVAIVARVVRDMTYMAKCNVNSMLPHQPQQQSGLYDVM